MALSTSRADPAQAWDEAESPDALRLARRYEAAWRERGGSLLDPEEFLDTEARACPGARLALLRTDLALRWESGAKVGAAWYRDRYGDLDVETLVALVYEEFCLVEEERGSVDPAVYYEQFPEVADRLRRVLDIHGLVGSGSGLLAGGPEPSASAFPEAGQTIGGFHLVEELGRGAFARVFLARERQLADRPVALKVARTGSREPQTLARLQHTHIVPVHSYRTDPATGLHLLCMPYFGRVTLARVLADPKAQSARSGAELVEALDRLGGDDEPTSGRSAGRSALAQRSFAQALAWWGARMAEALEHAHDRGVLHRDVKPSNVLVTADGMPMLLDFNLARTEADAADALGGTFDYMAPEHLEELADGAPGRVDARSDVYSLGVLLFEALAGARPFPRPNGARSAADLLLDAAAERRRGAPWLGDAHPEVPDAFEAVVRRCLEPDPADRYATAADLAADLQAVADDLPLRFAREPWSSRAQRWLRRHRRLLALLTPAVVALGLLAGVLLRTTWSHAQLRAEIKHQVEVGQALLRAGKPEHARGPFETAARLAEGRFHCDDLHRRARALAVLATQTQEARASAEALLQSAEALKFRLSGFGGDPETAAAALRDRLRPLYVLENPHWTELAEQQLLDAPTRAAVAREVNELFFARALSLERTGSAREAVELCDRALLFSPTPGPWLALRARLAVETTARGDDPPSEDAPAGAWFLWGLLRENQADGVEALRRAVRLDPGQPWRHAVLARALHRAGHGAEARTQAGIAVALRPGSPWARAILARITREDDETAVSNGR